MHYSLHQCKARIDEIDRALMDPSVLSNGRKLKTLTKERAHLEPMVMLWQDLERSRQELAEAKELLQDPEPPSLLAGEIALVRGVVAASSENWSLASGQLKKAAEHLSDTWIQRKLGRGVKELLAMVHQQAGRSSASTTAATDAKYRQVDKLGKPKRRNKTTKQKKAESERQEL